MELQTVKKRYKLAEYARMLEEQNASGLTIEEYCKAVGICKQTFFRRRRTLLAALPEPEMQHGLRASTGRFVECKIREAGSSPNKEVRLSELEGSCIAVEIGQVKIRIPNGMSRESMEVVLSEVLRVC